MGWGPRLAVIFLTTAAGAGAAFGVASFLIQGLQITNREGASGYFAVFVTGIGLIGGFLVGLITALAVQSGFWKAQGYALGIVVALAVAGAVLPLVLNDNGPRLDGDALVLEVELKCPSGWKPNHKSRSSSFCWMQEQAVDGPREVNPAISAGLTLKDAPAEDGQWVIPCVADLTKTRKGRFLRVFIGNQIDVTIQVPLPAKPKRNHKEWSPWSTAGFLPQKDAPVPAGYAFRCRVRGDTEYRKEHPDPGIALKEEWEKGVAATPANAPLAQWLPLFEDPRGQPSYYQWGEFPGMDAVKALPAGLAPLLRSRDVNVRRHAIFAATILDPLPPSLIEPLAEAGRATVELMKDARAAGTPDDPDLLAEDKAHTYFFYWAMAMEKAGAAGTAARKAALEEIGREARGGAPDGGIHSIAEQVRKELDTISAPR